MQGLSSLWGKVNRILNTEIQHTQAPTDPFIQKKEHLVESFVMAEKDSIANGDLDKEKETKVYNQLYSSHILASFHIRQFYQWKPKQKEKTGRV